MNFILQMKLALLVLVLFGNHRHSHAFTASHGLSPIVQKAFALNEKDGRLWRPPERFAPLTPWRQTHLYARSSRDTKQETEQPKAGPVLNLSLFRQTLFSQIFIGWTIWTGGVGAQVLQQRAHFDTAALALAAVCVLPLIYFSRVVETSESPVVADLNLSTNMLVLRLFGDMPQPILAFAVSALLSGITGLVEETTFRGVLLPELAQSNGLPAALALSTLIFAALHVNPIGLFRGGQQGLKDTATLIAYQLVTGSWFAIVYLATNNLAVPVLTHGFFDFYVFFATHLMVTGQMKYARERALMPVATGSVEAKWRQARGDDFLLMARETYYLADTNKDGVLSREELRIALYSYGIQLSAGESEVVTQAADRDASGTIDFGEFLDFVGPTGSPGKAIKSSLL